jgi:hypothetical protein
VLEARRAGAILRLRMARGWVSVTASDGMVLMAPVRRPAAGPGHCGLPPRSGAARPAGGR